MSKAIAVLAVFDPEPGRRAELLTALVTVIPDVHREDGCLLYALHEAEDGTVVLIENWRTAEALDTHARGPVVATLNQAISQLIARPPVVTRMTPVPAGAVGKGVL